jgi:hypothetical protein
MVFAITRLPLADFRKFEQLPQEKADAVLRIVNMFAW